MVAGTFVVLVGLGVWAYAAISSYPTRPHDGPDTDIEIIVAPGMKFPEVAKLLKDADIIGRPTWFRLYAMHKGLANRVRAGRYVLRGNLSPEEVLTELVKGTQAEQVTVTIPEGKNMLEVFALLDRAHVCSAQALERVARDPAWLSEQGIDGKTPDGYLFPDTYRFAVASTPKKVLETMVRHHREVYDQLRKQHARSAQKLRDRLTAALRRYHAPIDDWDDREFVIMASIIEKEAVEAEERPIIASVFYNRLTRSSFGSRRLETDPTIRYGCTVPTEKSAACRKWDATGRLFTAQLTDDDNPYNTYRHAFLPPGPIGNPGRASLAAALAPADSDYLYFVARSDRRHHVFSKTFAEHDKWVRVYQKGAAPAP